MSFAKALYDYNPDAENQLKITASEVLAVISKTNETWWEAENKALKRGLVPSNYLQEMELPDEIMKVEIGDRENMMVKATRGYSSSKQTHLQFEADELINVIEICFNRWWIGELKRDPSIIGVFPSAFVKIVNLGYKSEKNKIIPNRKSEEKKENINLTAPVKKQSKSESMKKKEKRMSMRKEIKDVREYQLGILRKPLEFIEPEELNTIWSKLFSLFISKGGSEAKGVFLNLGEQNDIAKLQEAFNQGVKEISQLTSHDIQNIHSIPTFIKLWINFLPDPICTEKYSEEFLTSECIENEDLRKSKLQTLIYLLPSNNRFMLQSLLSFVFSIKAAQTDMEYLNELAMSFPTLLFDKKLYQKKNEYRTERYGVRSAQLMLSAYKELFESLSSPTIKYEMNKENKIEVIAGNKHELFIKIADPLYGMEKIGLDQEYVGAFLTTHDYFCTDMEVLNYLSQVYFEHKETQEEWAYKIRINVITVLKIWMNKYLYGEFGEKLFSSEFQEKYLWFMNGITDNLYRNLLNSVDFKTTMKKKFSLKSYKYYRLPDQKYEKIQTTLSNKYIEKIAEAITAINEEIWFNIEPVELLHKNFEKPEKAPQLNALINLFNKFQEWGAAQVMLASNQNVRLEMAVLVIKLSFELKKMNNFNASFALFAGLNLPAVSRLKKLWESLEKHKIWRKYLDLKDLYSPSGNHKNYQDSLKSSEPPVIPYIGLYNKYLFTIEETNKTMTEEGLINFQKLRMLYKLINEIQMYQKKSYDLTPDPGVVESLCRDMRLDWDENKLYEISLKIRPRDMK